MIDIVIVSDGTKPKHRELTLNAIETAKKYTKGCQVFVCDVPPVRYSSAHTLYADPPFNYNASLNYGGAVGKNPYIGFFNNDVVFTDGWFEVIQLTMEKFNLDSASPFCPNTHPVDYQIQKHSGVTIGKQVRKYVCGWALVLTREFWEKIGRFDEGNTFWCSDNRYQKQLMEHKGKHALVTSSEVIHLGSQTLNDLKSRERRKYTVDDVKKYNRDFNENVFGWGK